MNILASAQSWLKSQCIFVPEDWIQACIEWIQEENQEGHLPQQQLNSLVYEQWLLSDLHELQTSCLPEGLNGIAKFHLKGTFALQIDSIVDVSKSFYSQLQDVKGTFNTNSLVSADEPTQKPWEPKPSQMLKLMLTDGTQTVQGMEYQPLKQLSGDIRPGTKVIVEGDVLCRHGVLMLREYNIRVLGGEVDTQIEANTPVSTLEQAMTAGAANAGKTHRQEFEGGEIKPSKQSLSTRGGGQGSIVKPVDCLLGSHLESRNTVSVQNVNRRNVKKETRVQVRENLDDQWDDEFNYDALMDDFDMERFDDDPTPPQQERGAIKPVGTRMEPTVMNQPYVGITNHPKTSLFTPNTVDDSYKGSKPTNVRENNLNHSRINGPRNTSFNENVNRVNSRSSTRTGNNSGPGAVSNSYQRGGISSKTEEVENDLDIDDDFDLNEMDTDLNYSSGSYSRNAVGKNVSIGNLEMSTRTSVKVDVAEVKSEINSSTANMATFPVHYPSSRVVLDNKTSNAMFSSLGNLGVNPAKSSSDTDMNQTKPAKKRSATTLHQFFTPSKISKLDDIKCEADDDFQNPPSTSTPMPKACRVEMQAERKLEAKSLKPPLMIPADLVSNPIKGVKGQQPNLFEFDFNLDLDRVVFNSGFIEKSPERPFTYLLEVVKCMGSQTFPKSQFKVKAYISTLTSKLSLREDQWSLSCKLNDGTSSLVVDLSNKVLTQLIGFSGQDSMEMRKRAKFDPTVKDILVEGLQQCQQKLIDLMCIMEVEISPSHERPIVIALIPISSEHVQALYRCVSCRN